jgi:hypothetical protein
MLNRVPRNYLFFRTGGIDRISIWVFLHSRSWRRRLWQATFPVNFRAPGESCISLVGVVDSSAIAWLTGDRHFLISKICVGVSRRASADGYGPLGVVLG